MTGAITVDDIRRAMEMVRTAPRTGCPPHIVRPAPRGMRWELTDDATAQVIRCSSLCGWAAFAKAVPE